MCVCVRACVRARARARAYVFYSLVRFVVCSDLCCQTAFLWLLDCASVLCSNVVVFHRANKMLILVSAYLSTHFVCVSVFPRINKSFSINIIFPLGNLRVDKALNAIG